MFENLNTSLVPIALFYLACSLVSCVGNGIMIAVFIKEKSFHSPCHYLITLSCAADMLHLCGHFVFNFHLFTNTTSSQENCYWMLFLTTIGKCMSNPLILVMGIDRLIACRAPVIYRTLMDRPAFYLLAQLSFPMVYTAFFLTSGYLNRDSETQIVCQVPLALAGPAFSLFNISGIFVNCAIVIVYFCTYLQLRGYAGVTQMKVVFKSILWTVIFVILGWLSVTIANQFAIFLAKDASSRQMIAIHAGIGVNLASASNVFVFYAINTEYRLAIRKMFGIRSSGANIDQRKTITRTVSATRRSSMKMLDVVKV